MKWKEEDFIHGRDGGGHGLVIINMERAILIIKLKQYKNNG